MFIYSLLLAAVFVLGAPWWLWRMATSGRYRAGLAERLGRVPPRLARAVAGRPAIWVHAVSVGEVLAAARLIAELEAARPGLAVVLSTTTKTGQELARKKLRPDRVFYFPLDFAFAARSYLRALQPKMLVLMESELWPRLLVECGRAGIPVAVVNGRVSDRSLPRYRRLRALWRPLLHRVSLLLAQDAEDARRFTEIGAPPDRVHAVGNLKYDVRESSESPMTARIRTLRGDRRLVVAGSTLPGEEDALLDLWPLVSRMAQDALLLIAPRHPQRFDEVESLLRSRGIACTRCSSLTDASTLPRGAVLLLDTIGDLSSIYALASVAFVGGSLVPAGGHNPLEPAQFAVPVVMGPSYENFRQIVAKLLSANGIAIVPDKDALAGELTRLLTDAAAARTLGEHGRAVFAAESGATARTVQYLLTLLEEPA